MRGGARHNAGRPAGRIKLESLPFVDIRLAGFRRLKPEGRFSCGWNLGNEETASVVASMVDHGSMVLQTRFPHDGDGGRNFSQTIRLDYTACHFGKQRRWFRCPHCARRVAKLYLVRGDWRCRRSFNAAYTSQSMDWMNRMHRRIARFEAKLGEDGGRPYGMRWRTYNQIIDQCNEVRNRLAFMGLL